MTVFRELHHHCEVPHSAKRHVTIERSYSVTYPSACFPKSMHACLFFQLLHYINLSPLQQSQDIAGEKVGVLVKTPVGVFQLHWGWGKASPQLNRSGDRIL